MFHASGWTLSVAALMLAAASAAAAEYIDPAIDWKESGVPQTPPAFDVRRLIPIDAPSGSSLKFGIDPETISIGEDGVVRYVVVASSPQGATNALFEGIRCSTGEYRVYARYSGGGWLRAGDSDWQSVFANMRSRHPLRAAQAGICVGRAPNGPADVMVRSLRAAGGAR